VLTIIASTSWGIVPRDGSKVFVLWTDGISRRLDLVLFGEDLDAVVHQNRRLGALVNEGDLGRAEGLLQVEILRGRLVVVVGDNAEDVGVAACREDRVGGPDGDHGQVQRRKDVRGRDCDGAVQPAQRRHHRRVVRHLLPGQRTLAGIALVVRLDELQLRAQDAARSVDVITALLGARPDLLAGGGVGARHRAEDGDPHGLLR